MKQPKVIEFAGWYGVLAILTAYALVSFEVIDVHSLAYPLINLTGALGLLASSLAKKDKQPAVLNSVWAGVALVAIIKLF